MCVCKLLSYHIVRKLVRAGPCLSGKKGAPIKTQGTGGGCLGVLHIMLENKRKSLQIFIIHCTIQHVLYCLRIREEDGSASLSCSFRQIGSRWWWWWWLLYRAACMHVETVTRRDILNALYLQKCPCAGHDRKCTAAQKKTEEPVVDRKTTPVSPSTPGPVPWPYHT